MTNTQRYSANQSNNTTKVQQAIQTLKPKWRPFTEDNDIHLDPELAQTYRTDDENKTTIIPAWSESGEPSAIRIDENLFGGVTIRTACFSASSETERTDLFNLIVEDSRFER